LEEDALTLRAGHSDPQVEANFPPIALPGRPKNALVRLGLKLFSGNHGRETTLLLLAASALLLLGLGLREGGRLAVAVVAVSIPLTYAALQMLARLHGRPPSGDIAVGYALYSGYPKSLEIFQVPLLVGVPGLVALLAVYLRRRLTGPSVQPTGETPVPPSVRETGISPAGRIGALVLGLLAAALACYFWPDLAATCPSTAPPLALGWDRNNGLVWQYLIQNGARPFRDFWYPYSGQMLFELAFPRGDILLALHRFVLFAVFLLAVYLNTGKSILATVGIFGTVFGLYVGDFFEWAERYGLIVNVILTYVALDRESRRWQWSHVLFWVATVQCVVIEPTGVLYAGVPLLVAWVLEVLRAPAAFRDGLVGRLCREFGPPAAFLALVGLYLAVRGELMGFLGFMASLGSQAACGAYPIDSSAWLKLDSPAESFLLWSVVVLTGVGLARHLGQLERNEKTGRIMLLLGIAGAMLLLKQIVRPHIAGQILIINVVGILFYLFAERKANAWQWTGTVLAAGLLFANLGTSCAPGRISHRVRTVVARVRTSAPLLALKGSERRALTALRFAPERFRLSDAHMAAIHALLGLAHTEEVQPLFVLSDDPVFYILAGARPYFHTNGYNAAPIREQKRVVGLLEAAPPSLILWRSGDLGVDNVPPVVRDPLVYEHVILHYVPHAAGANGAFALLRQRRPEEPVAIDFWRARLGSALHLGHIPRFSSMAKFRVLTGGPSEEDAEFLTVKITDPAAAASPRPEIPDLPQIGGYKPAGRTVAIPVECAGRRFTIALSIVPQQSEYHVLLNRVWFWGPLKKAGLSPALGDPGPGIEVHIERRAGNEDILY
jgi:hypothetical protein